MKLQRARFSPRGGVHPAYHKARSAGQPIAELPLPDLLAVSMAQHMGAPAVPLVKKGDTVLRGQPLGEASGFISAAVHAPVSGTVRRVGEALTAAGVPAPCVEIEPDGEQRAADPPDNLGPWQQAEPAELVARVARAGIAGMGGAGFPTHVKLSPPPDKPIDTLIVNGAECEPYLTADHRLMLEQTQALAEGAHILRHILGARKLAVAIEENKPDAIRAVEQALSAVEGDTTLAVLKTEYPQGAEKQQIYSVTGRRVPCGGLPMDVGCVVENVGTVVAVRDAVVHGRPLTERVTTVTGAPVRRPANLRAPIGTRFCDLLAFCGGLDGEAVKVLAGGPMMGLAQHSLDVATTKTTSGLLALPASDVSEFSSMPCIGCGRCVAACPMGLVPSELSQLLEAEDYEAAEALNVLDCIECGCCAFACPARRPMVQHMRRGKARAMLKRRQRQAAS